MQLMEDNSHQNDIPIWFSGTQRWMTGLTKRTTCADVIYALLYSCGLHETDSTDNYAIFEKWREVERPLSSRTKILKIWFSWGEEQPNVQLNLRSLDDYFLPGESSLYLRSRRRHKKSGRHRSRNTTSCRCHNKRGCVACSRLRSLEEVVKLVVSQERKIQDIGDRIYDTDRLIDRHESRIHNHRVQQNGQDYVQNSYLNSHSSESSSSLDCSSFSSLDLKDLSAVFRESTLQELEEISRLCDDLAHVERRLGEEQTKIKEMTPEIEHLAEKMGVVAEKEGEANAELESTRTEMIRAVTVHVTNEYNERELDRKMDLCLGHLDKKSQAVKELQDELSRCEERLGAGQVSEMLDADHNIGHAVESRDNSVPHQTSSWQSSDTTSPPLYKETYRPFERGWGSRLSEQPTTHMGNSHQLSYSAKPHPSHSYSPNNQQSHSYSPNNQQSHSYSPNPQQSHSYSPNPQQSHSYSPNPQQSHSYSSNNQQSHSYSPNPQQSHSYSSNNQQSHSYSSPNPQQSNSCSPNPQQSNSCSPNPQQSNSNSAQTARRQVSNSYSIPPDSYSPRHEQTNPYSPKFQKTIYSSHLPTKVHSKNSASDTRASVQKKSVTFSQDIEDSEFTEDLDTLSDPDQRRENSVDSSDAVLRGSAGFKDDSSSHHYANIGPIFSERLTDPASLNRVTFSRDSRSERRTDEGKTLGGFNHRSRSAERSTGHSVDRPRAEMSRSENGGSNLTNHRVYNSHVVNHYGLEWSDQRDVRRNNSQAQVAEPNCYRASQESYERTRSLTRPDEGQTYSGGRLETPPLHSHHNSEGAQNAFQLFHAPTDESQIPSRDEHVFQFDKPDLRSSTNKHSRSDTGKVHGAVPGMQLSSWREMRDTSGAAHNSGHLFDQGISDPRLNNDSGSPRFSMNEVAGKGSSGRGRAENSAENLLNSVQGYKQQTDTTKGIDSAGGARSTEAHALHRPTLSERGGLDVPGGTPYSNKQEVISTKQQTDIHNGQQTSEALAGRQKNEQTRASTAGADNRASHEIHRTNTHNRPSGVPNHGEHVGVHQDSNHVQFVHYALTSTANGVHGNQLVYGGDGPRAKAESKSFRNYDTAHSTAQNASLGESRHEGSFSFLSGGEHLSSIASPNKDINGVIPNGERGALYHIVSNKMNRIKNEQNSSRQKTGRSESSSSEPPTWVTHGESMSTNVVERRTTGADNVSNGISAISGPVPIRDKHAETFMHKSEPTAVNGSTSFKHHSQVTKNYDNHIIGAVTKDWASSSPKGSNPYFLTKTGNKTPGQIFEDHYQHQAKSEYKPQTPLNGYLTTVQQCTLPGARQMLTVNLNDIPIMYDKQSGKSSRDFKLTGGVAHRPLMTNGQGVVRTKLEDTNDSNSDTGLSSMHSDETANMETLV